MCCHPHIHTSACGGKLRAHASMSSRVTDNLMEHMTCETQRIRMWHDSFVCHMAHMYIHPYIHTYIDSYIHTYIHTCIHRNILTSASGGKLRAHGNPSSRATDNLNTHVTGGTRLIQMWKDSYIHTYIPDPVAASSARTAAWAVGSRKMWYSDQYIAGWVLANIAHIITACAHVEYVYVYPNVLYVGVCCGLGVC